MATNTTDLDLHLPVDGIDRHLSGYFSTFGLVSFRIVGSASALGSIGILYLIFISETKLKIVYHRIMFLLSLGTLASSIAMGLTTLPMPTDDHLIINYPLYEGTTRLGNSGTCVAQGFFYVLGSHVHYAYLSSLCVYYTCAIAFQMQEDRIRRKVEPILHVVSLSISFCTAVPYIFLDLYNPLSRFSYCGVGTVPGK